MAALEERKRTSIKNRGSACTYKNIGWIDSNLCELQKKRNDKGYWDQIEQYVQVHSEAKFSHSICPECLAKLYPEIALSRELETKN